MKTSNWWYVFFFLLGGIAMVAAQNLLFVKAVAQPGPTVSRPAGSGLNVRGDGSVVELQADGTIIERHKDGKVLRTTTRVPTFRVEQLADGTIVQRPEFTDTPDGGTVLFGGHPAADPETAKLLQEEMQATQAAQKLWSEFRSADSEGHKETIKTQLREKLVVIFDLQQKRRASEIAKIEERMTRLKETMNKRDAAKDDIVNRRLDVLTGGIDELGWEDTFRPMLPPPGPGAANVPQYNPASPFGPPAVGPQPYRPTAPAAPRRPATGPRPSTPIDGPGPGFLPSPIDPATPAPAAPPASAPMLSDPVSVPAVPLLPAAGNPAASSDDAPATDPAAPAAPR